MFGKPRGAQPAHLQPPAAIHNNSKASHSYLTTTDRSPVSLTSSPTTYASPTGTSGPPTIAPPLVSPLQMTFDFELSAPPQAPSASWGIGATKSWSEDSYGFDSPTNTNFLTPGPPVLPPIPRVASATRNSPPLLKPQSSNISNGSSVRSRPVSGVSLTSRRSSKTVDDDGVSGRTLSVSSRRRSELRSMTSFEHPVDLMPTLDSRPSTAGGAVGAKPSLLSVSNNGSPALSSFAGGRSSTSGNSTPQMSASLFPSIPPSSATSSTNPPYNSPATKSFMLPAINSGPPMMTRDFVDSRDKPYAQHPSVHHHQAAPVLRPTNTLTMNTRQSPTAANGEEWSTGSQRQSPTAYTPRSPYQAIHVPPHSGSGSGSSNGNAWAQVQSPASLYAPQRPTNGTRASPESPAAPPPPPQPELPSGITRSYTLTETYTNGRPVRPSLSPSNSSIVGNRGPQENEKKKKLKKKKSLSKLPPPPSAATPPAAETSTVSTIGTPYAATSAAFPLPQHVATRPKTAGPTATVGGVSVPTHHTSSLTNGAASAAGKEKKAAEQPNVERRKTRLLNPLALLQRRRSGLENPAPLDDINNNSKPTAAASREEAGRSAAALAYASQKPVSTAAREKPLDFDPRIKGKVVHDFSAPRAARRTFSAASNLGPEDGSSGVVRSGEAPPVLPQLVTGLPLYADPAPPPPASARPVSSGHKRVGSSSVFTEHLSDGAGGGVRAERLENKEFVTRYSAHSSSLSGESGVLPVFAGRRSMYGTGLGGLDAGQAALVRDEESKRNSERSLLSGGSGSGVSPVTARSSGVGGGGGVVGVGGPGGRERDMTLSPVSPRSTYGGTAMVLPPIQGLSPDSPLQQQPIGLGLGLGPLHSPLLQASRSSPVVGSPYRDSSQAPQLWEHGSAATSAMSPSAVPLPLSPFTHNNSNATNSPAGVPLPLSPYTNDTPLSPRFLALPPAPPSPLPSPGFTETPEIVSAEAFSVGSPQQASQVSSPVRLVEKRASAAGHSTTKGLKPAIAKNVSNASRFSFQFGEGSERQERALEDKHRRVASREINTEEDVDGEEEDGEFDEGAMDDLDELELEQRGQHAVAAQSPAGITGSGGNAAGGGLAHARQMLRRMSTSDDDEDDGSVYDDEDVPHMLDDSEADDGEEGGEVTYADHPAFRAHSAMKGAHSPEAGWRATGLEGYMVAPAMAKRVGSGENAAVAKGAGSGFYMQPRAAGYDGAAATRGPMDSSSYNATASHPGPGVRPELPHRDSGASERNRVLSGGTFGGPEASTNGGAQQDVRSFRDSETIPTHAGWAELQQVSSRDTPPSASDGANNRRSYFGNAEKGRQSMAYNGTIGQSLRARNAAQNQNRQYAHSDDEDEELYFDDGGFEQDVRGPVANQHRMDENAFDNPAYLARPSKRDQHVRELSALSVGAGGEGPYPSFAIPPAATAQGRPRQSQNLLLEDLPLQAPVDPRYIPQRNPSEDAKRMGLSDRVPPLPVAPGMGGEQAEQRMRESLMTYHAALAEAANKAASEGRFAREGSLGTDEGITRTLSARQDDGEEHDGASHYSAEESGEARQRDLLQVGDNGALGRSASNLTTGSRMDHSTTYSPPKMLFDFGFDATQPTSDAASESGIAANGFDDTYDAEDDNMINAANAEALENDADGFYGQEFGFYARPAATDGVQAVNGGYFGADGDDGLARQKSLREPNLTPITEKSEFSARSSYVNMGGHGSGYFGAASSAHAVPLSRLPISPLVEKELSLEHLRKVKVNAFTAGAREAAASPVMGKGTAPFAAAPGGRGSPSFASRAQMANTGYGYFGNSTGSRAESAASSAPGSAVLRTNGGYAGEESDATPRREVRTPVLEPGTARKVGSSPVQQQQQNMHSRNGSSGSPLQQQQYLRSGGEAAAAYERQQDVLGVQRGWAAEHRRAEAEGGRREAVQGGWI